MWRLAGDVVVKRFEYLCAMLAFAIAFGLWAPLALLGFAPAREYCRLLENRIRELANARRTRDFHALEARTRR